MGRFALPGMILLAVCLCICSVKAECVLQLHGYDAEGAGWNGRSITIVNCMNFQEILVDQFTLVSGEYSFIEFECPYDCIKVLVTPSFSGTPYFRVTDENGNSLHGPGWRYGNSKELTIQCDISDSLVPPQCVSSISEGEPHCQDGYVDEYNGGCDAEIFNFTPLENGQSICGSFGTFQDGADSDWYRFVLDRETDLEFWLTPDYKADFSLIQIDTCAEQIVLKNSYEQAYPNDQHHQPSYSINYQNAEPGEYYLRISPDSDYYQQCMITNNYHLTASFCNLGNHSGLELEEDMCSWDAMDVTNYGCAGDDSRFTQLYSGQPVKGTIGQHGGSDGPIQDYDWYRFHLWEPSAPRLNVISTTEMQVNIWKGDCDNLELIDTLHLSDCDYEQFEFPTILEIGDYYVEIYSVADQGIHCRSEYYLSLKNGIYGDSCHSPYFVDLSVWSENPTEEIVVRGDTTWAFNDYDAQDYGCGVDLSTPEFTAVLQPNENVLVNIRLEDTQWDTRLVITEEWPPVSCYYSDGSGEGNPVEFENFSLEAGKTYFVFLEGANSQSGYFKLLFQYADMVDPTIELDLQLSKSNFKYGDRFLLKVSTHIIVPEWYADICLILDVEGEYFFYPDFTPDFHTYSYYGDIGYKETTLIDVEWPDVEGSASGMSFYAGIVRGSESEIILLSNIDTVEFSYGFSEGK